MYRIELAVEIAATPDRVWRALCDPSEVTQWDSGVADAIDAPAGYPRPGQIVHWRCRDGRILVDRPQQVDPMRRLRSLLTLGGYDMDEAYDLSAVSGRTRIDLSLDLTLRLPAGLGPIAERLYAGRRVRNDFKTSLARLKRHCEASA